MDTKRKAKNQMGAKSIWILSATLLFGSVSHAEKAVENEPREWTNQNGNLEPSSAIASVRAQIPSLEEMTPVVGKKGENQFLGTL